MGGATVAGAGVVTFASLKFIVTGEADLALCITTASCGDVDHTRDIAVVVPGTSAITQVKLVVVLPFASVTSGLDIQVADASSVTPLLSVAAYALTNAAVPT